MKHSARPCLLLGIGLLLAGFAGFAALPAAAGADPGPAQTAGPAIDLKNFDRSVSPCGDFYRFANGTWIANNKIPADRPSWGSFNELHDRNQKLLHQLLEDAAADKAAAATGIKGKVGTFYRAGMDTAKIDRDGLSPLKPELDRIAAVDGPKTLATALARQQRYLLPCEIGIFCFLQPGFEARVAADPKDSSVVIAQLAQGGLGLPERDYYLKDDAETKEIRKNYEEHLTRVLTLSGDAPERAAAGAKAVLDLETRLARASMSNVDERDPNKIYHKMTAEELARLAPGFPWKDYFASLGMPEPGPLNVAQPDFFKEFAALATSLPPATWRSYLRTQLVWATAPYLPKPFVDQQFAFYDRTFQGATEQPPRWKKVLGQTDNALGEALGQLYVDKAFPPESKARMQELVGNLKAALRDNLNQLDWISDETRKQAQVKLDAIGVKIGYPDRWRDYSKLKLEDGTPYVRLALAAAEFEFDRQLANLGKAPDRNEWVMTPPTVNAYYSPNLNEIVFPAGILQPPFFFADADDAVNYGGIGAVIGHEITHGFDDEGRQFDAKGNLRSWWTPEDAKKFTERAAVVEDQFNNYEVMTDLKVNGKLTLGENIADLGGVKLALAALRKSMEGKPAPAPIDGFTAEQRFFLSYAQIWRQNTRPEAMRLYVATNPHAPGRFRVLGPLANLPDFAAAFQCDVGKGFLRSEDTRARIW